ncbi:GntR family transcriptional regulator [Arsenicicoccus dermatophilus]|uniref:GntR family transcriptional regulator n=1 Tax=Arsenicicoccus dermatophilus TaxID=1076331 RepID=UPI003917449B
MALDLDDPRPPYQQVAASLRASILTGVFPPGEKMPSQAELSEHYGVARMTVQQALRILKDDGLVTSRQGSGMFVRERMAKPVGLRPHIEQAFRDQHVTIDFAGQTSETLHGVLSEPLDQVRTGRLSPETIAIRVLVPDLTRPLALPAAADGDETISAKARDRLRGITDRHLNALTATVEELADLGLVKTGTVEARQHGTTPLFKAYVINDVDVFFGYYPVVRHEVRLDSDRAEILDPMGKDTVLFQYTDDGNPDDPGTQFVHQTRTWFTSLWDTVAEPRP